MTQEALFVEALTLPKDARARLAARLLDSLQEGGASANAEANWADEVSRRLALYRSGTLKAETMDEALDIIRDAVSKTHG
jgi:putative addiction module component (TIGR02574 family)